MASVHAHTDRAGAEDVPAGRVCVPQHEGGGSEEAAPGSDLCWRWKRQRCVPQEVEDDRC